MVPPSPRFITDHHFCLIPHIQIHQQSWGLFYVKNISIPSSPLPTIQLRIQPPSTVASWFPSQPPGWALTPHSCMETCCLPTWVLPAPCSIKLALCTCLLVTSSTSLRAPSTPAHTDLTVPWAYQFQVCLRDFALAVPSFWNILTPHLCMDTFLSSFRTQLLEHSPLIILITPSSCPNITFLISS